MDLFVPNLPTFSLLSHVNGLREELKTEKQIFLFHGCEIGEATVRIVTNANFILLTIQNRWLGTLEIRPHLWYSMVRQKIERSG